MFKETTRTLNGMNDGTAKNKPFKVDGEVRKRTTKCQHNFKCLAAGGCPGCEFDGTCVGDHIFVKMNKENMTCPYAMSFGFSFICQCPTRCEIYRKYNQ